MDALNEIGIPTRPRRFPVTRTTIQGYSDYFVYLLFCLKESISSSYTTGPRLWETFKDRIEFVITHPDHWNDLRPLREAATLAGMATGARQLSFVEESAGTFLFIYSPPSSGADQRSLSSVLILLHLPGSTWCGPDSKYLAAPPHFMSHTVYLGNSRKWDDFSRVW